MSRQFNGITSHISQLYPMATYVHCTAHTINLAVPLSYTVWPIRNRMGIIGKFEIFSYTLNEKIYFHEPSKTLMERLMHKQLNKIMLRVVVNVFIVSMT